MCEYLSDRSLVLYRDKNISSLWQTGEQENRSLRKLASFLAYCAFKKSHDKGEPIFHYNNFEKKGLLWIYRLIQSFLANCHNPNDNTTSSQQLVWTWKWLCTQPDLWSKKLSRIKLYFYLVFRYMFRIFFWRIKLYF